MDTLIWSDESNLEASIKWEDMQIALNSEFLIAILWVIKSDEVIIELNWAYSPVLFKDPNKDDFLHIIMPLRI
jgi:DNA polymerase-3 subunit beta